MRKLFDYSIYLVTNRTLSNQKTIDEVVRSAVRGGVTAVQLREKDCSTRQYIELALQLQRILIPLNIPLIINDRVDVALAVNADGVHIGQNDMSCNDVRRLMGRDAVIGLSVETLEQAIEAEKLDVDYLGVSPVFQTPTKADTFSEWGIEGLKVLRKRSSHKLIAIGGINKLNAEAVLNAGADGLAVVSAICSSSDPEEASKQLWTIIRKNRNKDGNP
jgi:thiamine-phosphate pyrophosphorylase